MKNPFMLNKDAKEGFIYASKTFFTRECVITVADIYAKKYFVSVYPSDENSVVISLRAKDNHNLSEDMLRQIMNELIDFQSRIDLENKFGEIRNKIVEYAFSPVEGL